MQDYRSSSIFGLIIGVLFIALTASSYFYHSKKISEYIEPLKAMKEYSRLLTQNKILNEDNFLNKNCEISLCPSSRLVLKGN